MSRLNADQPSSVLRRSCVMLCVLVCCAPALFASSHPQLPAYAQQYRTITLWSMSTLGSWALGNIALGLSLQSSRGGSDRYFHIMNAAWNSVNLAIAGFSLAGVSGLPGDGITLADALSQQSSITGFLLLNSGLDLAYIMTGFYLTERSHRGGRADMLDGFGRSLVVQGGFLLIFDLVLFFIHRANGRILTELVRGDGQLSWYW